MAQTNPLRALMQRLTSTPVEELPSIAYFLATSISSCLDALQNPGTDKAALLHKLKTRISSLLQDRTPEGRLTAVIVAKAVIEAGGREILVDLEPWIRGLIGILNKSDSVATKRLAILTIARAFVLTEEYPSIVREVTTPLLPSFNTACLAAIRPKATKSEKGTWNVLSPLLSTTLQCWNELLPRYPTTFRPFVTRFRPICLSLLSDAATPETISRSAGTLLVALHHSAPKNNAPSEWSQLCQDIIRAAHATADSLFRSVNEDWKPTELDISQITGTPRSQRGLPSSEPDGIGLAKWQGMHNGMQRLSRLLVILEASVSKVTAAEVSIPISGITDLCTRLLTVTLPGTSKDSPYTQSVNSEFGKDERETLWSEIPIVHVYCLRLLSVVVKMLQRAVLPISKTILDRLTWLYDAEYGLPDIRASAYELLGALLPIMGPTVTEVEAKKVSGMIRHACKDLLPCLKSAKNDVGNEKGAKTATMNVDSFAGPTKPSAEQTLAGTHSELQSEATNLLSIFLQHVPAHSIPNTLRAEIDRTAVLTQDKRALLASVLNPATAQQGQHAPASLLPFLAQTDSGLEVEALLRPRMAVIVDKQSRGVGGEIANYDLDEIVKEKDLLSGNSLSDRLGEALRAPGPANAEDSPDLSGLEVYTATENNSAMEDAVPFVAVKRSFAAMSGDGLNGWHTSGSAMLPDADVKKARVDGHGINITLWGDDSAPSKSIINGKVGTDVGLTQQGQPEISLQKQPIVGVEIQPAVKSISKEKGPTTSMDDSESDIPEINIEPDTDEDEDDDDDADMYG